MGCLSAAAGKGWPASDLRLSELQDAREVFARHGRDREPGLLEERQAVERRIGLHLRERYGRRQRLDRHEVDGGPVSSLVARRIWVRLAFHPRDAHDGLVVARMIEEDEVSLLHLAQVVTRFEVADAVPGGLLVLDEARKGVDLGLALREKVARHRSSAHGSSSAASRAKCPSKGQAANVGYGPAGGGSDGIARALALALRRDKLWGRGMLFQNTSRSSRCAC